MQEKNNFNSIPYLKDQIIAYIGNKRRLLSLIYRAVQTCLADDYQGKYFLDLFAGSGVVSRLAKYLGFRVISNDWEDFSYVINQAYIETNKRDLVDMYRNYEGIDNIIKHLNNLPSPQPEEQYIAKYYCPKTDDTKNVDYNKERLFYTKSNGLFIDKIRNEIENLYPTHHREKQLLIALLLYEAATHTNTSGVFKAYHKGFGGHNRDALKRILTPIKLSRPVLIDSNYNNRVFKQDANALIGNRRLFPKKIDMVYIDPPYNQHQYGSNYHMLNTITLWDKIPINLDKFRNGKLVEKAGIRKDWIKTKSPYCYRDQAEQALKKLINDIESNFILISYSTEGIIPFPSLLNICQQKGSIQIVTNEYTKYRGGKQSVKRLNTNIEFVFIIDTSKQNTKKSIKNINSIIIKKNLLLQFKKKYCCSALREHFIMDKKTNSIGFKINNSLLWLKTKCFFEIECNPQLEKLSIQEMELLIKKLIKCQCKDKTQELKELLAIIDKHKSLAKNYDLLNKIPGILKKIAHKKYRETFRFWLKQIKRIKAYPLIQAEIKTVEQVALKRFNG